MMALDLDTLNLDELMSLRKDIDKTIAGYEERRRKEARAALEAKAREMGFTLGELAEGKAKRAPVNPPKYRHPENPELTWSGRGRQPGWIKDALAQGKELEAFLIP